MERIIDGSYTLEQTHSAVLFQEAGGYELLSLRKGSADGLLTEGRNANQPVNHATFQETQPVGHIPGEIQFIAVTNGQSASSLIANQMTDGWIVMFIAPVFVKGKETQVVVFRHQSPESVLTESDG